MVSRLVAELERVSVQLAELDKGITQQALDDPQARRLMTIPGVGTVVAPTVLVSTPEKLSSYFGLTPTTHQSGDHPARHGHISRQGNAAARAMLVEAALSAKMAPGPLRTFFNRVQKKAGSEQPRWPSPRQACAHEWFVQRP